MAADTLRERIARAVAANVTNADGFPLVSYDDATRIINAILPLVEQAIQQAREQKGWTCFHCDETFTDVYEAREHFGADEYKTPACRLGDVDVTALRSLEAANAELRRENERLENDARLWHESEADRVRRIGNVQWWQEMDSREGEKLVLQAQVAEKDAQIAQLQQAVDKLPWTLDNIYTIARREMRRTADQQRPEMWAHVLRLCEAVGCKERTVGVLRETPAPPQENG